MLKTLAAMAFACALLAAAARSRPDPVLVWNASGSVPIGLYAMRPAGRLYVGELIVARPPKRLADWLATRGYLPEGLPLLKRISALSGQTVCREGRSIFVDGSSLARAQTRDHLGRSLPAWRGCRILRSGDVFLLNADQITSLDGRYFGVLSASIVVGRAIPLWTKKEQ